jgi:ATP-binding cassette subfamily C protein LapB
VPIPATLLQRLLQHLQVPCELQPLEAACAQVQASLPADVQPAEAVRIVLHHTGIKGVQPVQLGWRRFDIRRLPALVCHAQTWYLAARADEQTIALTDAQGTHATVPEADLQDATVLWLRAARRGSGLAPLPHAGGPLARRLVWRELLREPGWIPKVVGATLLVNVLAVATSLFAMQVYDRVVPTLAYATLVTLVVGMALVIALDWVLRTLRTRILDSVAIQVDKRVSQHVFEHLLRLRLDAQPRSLGTLAAQVGGLESVRQFFSAGVIFGIVDLPFALLFIVLIAVIGGQVGWVYASMLPLALALGLVSQHRLRELTRRQIQRQTERQGVLVEAIRGAESIRAGNAAWRFADEWRAITSSIDAHAIQHKALASFSSVTTASLSSVAYVAAVVVGVWQIEAGVLTMGGLIACSILGGRVIAPVAQSVQYLTQWQGVSQSLAMVDRVLGLPQERRPDQTLLLPEAPPQTIELSQVRFTYADSPVQQLRIDQLTLRAGDRVIVVGPVGGGKSTLLKVLAGLYPPTAGRVRLGDADLWEIDPQILTAQVGYLPQAVHLFKGTLKTNLALSGTASDSRLLKITRDLGVDAIAMGSPLGMDLPISEGGEGLSGGQRQLVALARLVIEQPRLWLLDEPTASLDADSEARVWQVLADSVQPQDILVVATHRPMQALKLANRVLVVRGGEVVRDGNPQEVLPQWVARAATPAGPRMAPGGTRHVA